MNGVYLYTEKIDTSIRLGIGKKVLAQIAVFNRNGLNCSLVFPEESGTVIEKIMSRLPYVNLNPKWEYREEFKNIDYIYIRRPSYCNRYFINLLKTIKRQKANTIIVLEIPTYPYDSEFIKGRHWCFYIKDKFNRRKYKNYVDQVVTYSSDAEIWGIPAINTQNGIDLNTIPINRKRSHIGEEINLVAVAVFSLWHGYDRVIEGLHKYYQSNPDRPVILHLVGEGKLLNSYKESVEKYKMQEYVRFYGKLIGSELDEVFEKGDIAIASLGIHRINLKQVSTLKAREYCARGIPFIKAYQDKDFDETNFPYALTIEATEKPVNIQFVLDFYDRLIAEFGEDNIVGKMREFAEKNLTWDAQLLPVIEYIQKEYDKNGKTVES